MQKAKNQKPKSLNQSESKQSKQKLNLALTGIGLGVPKADTWVLGLRKDLNINIFYQPIFKIILNIPRKFEQLLVLPLMQTGMKLGLWFLNSPEMI